MKKFIGAFFCLLFVSLCTLALADVEINEINFPDDIFRDYVKEKLDWDGNGSLSDDEIDTTLLIIVNQKNISSLKGIEYFTELHFLDCSINQLSELDVSKNTLLEYFDCSDNQLTALNVRNNTVLECLLCAANQVTSLDVTKNSNLKILDCYSNQLKELNISKNPILKNLMNSSEPTEQNGHLVWGLYDAQAGYNINELAVDKDVTVITDNAEKADIGKAKVSDVKDQVYTGKKIIPKVIVKLDGKKLKTGKDYKLSYKNNKNIGAASVIVTGIGNYTGKQTVSFNIIPKPVTLSSVKAGKKQLTVNWKKTSGITGYEIQYGLKKDFKGAQSITIKGANTDETIIKKLNKRKTYYVRIRSFKTVKKVNYYSVWSSAKKAKVK